MSLIPHNRARARIKPLVARNDRGPAAPVFSRAHENRERPAGASSAYRLSSLSRAFKPPTAAGGTAKRATFSLMCI